MNNERTIWDFLKSKGLSDAGAAGLMGNLYAESGFNPKNLQNTFEKKLGMNDAAYTASVDSGKYTNFVRDSAGYGLAQWTYWSRKENLLVFAKAAKKSIGDLGMQLDFLISELGSYGLLENLKKAASVREASNLILLQFEKPASMNSKATQDKRAAYGQSYYDKYAAKNGGTSMSNSPLVSYTKISPNRTSPRNHAIDTITIHCVVGQLTAEVIASLFVPKERQASCNYCVGLDGRIGLICEEKDRSWCSFSRANDHRAITIETACDLKAPYAVRPVVYDALIKLCADICQRNGKKRMVWIEDKNKALAYVPKPDEMRMTLHRWFASTACPGDWLVEHMAEIADRVNALLGAETPSAPVEDKPFEPYLVRVKIGNLFIRSGPSTGAKSRGYIKPGTYTIVDESAGAGAKLWGKLKSGAGWIALDYTERV